MKKLISMIAAAVLLLSTSSLAANSKDVNEKVRAAFTKNFSRATGVNWKEKDDFYFASFTIGEVETEAAYNEEGGLVATSRKIDLAQLPLALSLELYEKYSGCTIVSQVTETAYEGQTKYYITVSNHRYVLNLKGTANGQIDVESKVKIKTQPAVF